MIMYEINKVGQSFPSFKFIFIRKIQLNDCSHKQQLENIYVHV